MKIFFYIFFLMIILSCGVKNAPQNPNKNIYPSVVEEYHKKIKSKYDGELQPGAVSRE